jgi:hypothetical protein
MATRMQQRRGTAAQWTSANPILNVGEIGYETDTNQFKIGDGTNHWDDLSYFLDETSLSTSLGDYVETSLLGVPDGVATLNSDGVLDSSQLPDISEITADTMNDVLIAGSGITKDYDDNGNTLTLSVDVSVLDEMSQDAIDAALTAGSGITKTYNDNANTITISVDTTVIATKAELAEVAQDSINDALIVANGIAKSYDDEANTITLTVDFSVATLTGTQTLENKFIDSANNTIIVTSQEVTNFYDASVDAAANALVNGAHTNISVNYDSEEKTIGLVAAPGYSDQEAIDAVGNVIGSGLLFTDDQFTIDANVVQTRVANVSDIEIGYLDGVTSGIQGQIDGKISASSTDTLLNKSINLANNTVSGTLAQFNTAILDADILPTSGGTLTGFLTLHADPTSALHAASKEYVDNISSGIIAKPAVDVATTANVDSTYSNGTAGVGATLTIAPTATLTIDGKNSWIVGASVLFKNQTNKAHNGRYVLTTVGDGSNSWVFTRCGLCDEASEIPGAYIFVKGGTVNNGTGWVQTVADPSTFTVGTDNIDVYQFSGSGTFTSGTGLTLTGNQFAIDSTVATLTGTQTLTGKTIAGADNTLTVRVANDISGLGTGVATFLATPSSANLASAVTNETGSGDLVFGTSPTIVTPRTQLAMNAQTGTTYTLVLTDASSRWVTMNNSSAQTVTVPPNIFSVGDQISIQQIGTGQVTFAQGSGVTITSAGASASAPKIRTRYASSVVICTASNVFTIVGDIV